MPSGRPYFHSPIHELETLVHKGWDHHPTLLAVLRELQHRSTVRAARLKSRVVTRLVELFEQTFRWPETHATAGKRKLADDVFDYEVGLLRVAGYKVGKGGLNENERLKVLEFVYKRSLPRMLGPAEYLQQWGMPMTGPRLHKMADSIAAFIRNAKRRNDNRMRVAVQHWEDDLAYLKRTYYDGRYDFHWPTT